MKLTSTCVRRFLLSEDRARSREALSVFFRYQEWGRCRPEIYVDYVISEKNLGEEPEFEECSFKRASGSDI